MRVCHPRCCGIDVHKTNVVCCLRLCDDDGQVVTELRRFATTTAGLLALRDWLLAQQVTICAMESTGVYWQPVFNQLEDHLTVWLVNAQRVKQVPGRKTDAKDCEWLADLLAHGLVAPSFVPPAPLRELRTLTRQRSQWAADRSRVANRLQKLLEAGNYKLASVLSDPLGVSGRRILAALAAGEREPERLADLAHGSLARKREALVAALHGQLSELQAYLLGELLDQWEELTARIERVSAQIARAMEPYRAQAEQLAAVPGLGPRGVEVVIAEVGVDMSVFPSDGQLCSWAGLCPGNHESGGKRYSGRCTQGNRWLQAALNQAAWAVSRSKRTYLGARFAAWRRRLGPKQAAVAMAHLLLRIIWHLLADPAARFVERGPDALCREDELRLERQLVRRLERLGHKVTLEPQPRAA